jgi:hypothetical protein
LPWLIFLIALLTAYVALPVSEALFIRASSANIPISDTWGFIPTIVAFVQTGHLSWGHLFSIYGNGRPAIERLGLLLSGKFISLNVQQVKMVSVVMGMLEAACAIWAFRLALPRYRFAVAMLAGFPVAVVIFSFNNWQNLLDEWNVMNLAAVALTFLAIVLAVHARSSERQTVYFLVSLALVCVIASFTGESGTLSWIACALLLWLPGGSGRLAERLGFSVVAVVFLVLYFSGASAVGSGHPLHHLLKVVDFALICLGNGVIGAGLKELPLARVIGVAEMAVVLLLGAWVAARRQWADRAVLVGIGLVAFGGMGAVATGVSRLQIGIGTAMSSRYVALTFPVAIGIYLVLVRMVNIGMDRQRSLTLRSGRVRLWALPCLVAAAFSVSGIVSDVKVAKVSGDKRAYYVLLREIACDPTAYSNADLSKFDHSGGLHPRQKLQLLAQIADLRRARLSVFSDNGCKEYAGLPRSAHQK